MEAKQVSVSPLLSIDSLCLFFFSQLPPCFFLTISFFPGSSLSFLHFLPFPPSSPSACLPNPPPLLHVFFFFAFLPFSHSLFFFMELVASFSESPSLHVGNGVQGPPPFPTNTPCFLFPHEFLLLSLSHSSFFSSLHHFSLNFLTPPFSLWLFLYLFSFLFPCFKHHVLVLKTWNMDASTLIFDFFYIFLTFLFFFCFFLFLIFYIFLTFFFIHF